MKTTYRFILAAFAAMAMVSCTKDIAADRQDTGLQDGVRTISVSFAAQTKTTLDGLQPEFDKGDVIKVSNGSACEEKVIDLDPQGNAFFTTTLTGPLTAVYPAAMAKMSGNTITGVMVPAIQTGRFKDANICKAEIAAGETDALFHNETAILRFYVDESVDVKALSLISKSQPITTETIKIDEDMELPSNYIYVLSEIPENFMDAVEDKDNLKSLYQGTDDPNKRLCYVAVLPFSGDDIRFMGISSIQEASFKYSNVTLNKGDIANAFIPYYIEVNVSGTLLNPTIQRWSYCNLGAFLPEEAGYYYSWGNPDGHWKNGVSDVYSFTADSYATSMGNNLTGDIQPTSQYDASFNAWVKSQGGSGKWHIPTKAEFETLLGANPSVTEEGLVFAEGLKFPFAGKFENGEFLLGFENFKAMCYWTSTIREGEESLANCMVAAFAPNETPIPPGFDPSARYDGLPIRPIYGDPQSTNISINPIQEGDSL